MSSTKPNGSFGRLRMTLVISALVWAVLGCFYEFEHRDILTNCPEYWGGFQPGRDYELLQDVFCIDGELDSNYKYSEEPSDTRNPPHEYQLLTLAQYRANKITDTRVHIITAGTRIRCSKITGYRNAGLSLTTVYGIILDAPLAGTELSFGGLAMADRSSVQVRPYDTLQPRLEFLKIVPSSEQATMPKLP
jgi:hypothetical protein